MHGAQDIVQSPHLRGLDTCFVHRGTSEMQLGYETVDRDLTPRSLHEVNGGRGAVAAAA
jgi:hypothetical protein